jgi:hypothetical protein
MDPNKNKNKKLVRNGSKAADASKKGAINGTRMTRNGTYKNKSVCFREKEHHRIRYGSCYN